MTDFRVSLGEMASRAENLRGYADQFKGVVDALGETEAALNAMWEGEAHTQFDTAFQSDRTQMYEFYQLVIAYVEALMSMRARYHAAEQQNVELARARCY